MTTSLNFYDFNVDVDTLDEEGRQRGFEKILKNCDPARLRSLKLDDYVVSNSLEMASRYLDNLKYLMVRCVMLSCSIDWNCLPQFVHLKSLSLCSCNIGDDEVEYFRDMPSLTELSMVQCYRITRAGLSCVGDLVQLKALTFSNENIGAENIRILRKLRFFKCMYSQYITAEDYADTLCGIVNLERLNLSGTKLNDSYLQAISTKYGCMRSLDISQCRQITNISVICVSKLATLTHLNLSFCINVSDAGVISLASLSWLRSLDISGCALVSDDGLLALSVLKYLSVVNIRWCINITLEGVDKFTTQHHSPVVLLFKV